MGTGFLFAGFLFLINPDLITFDIFPDFIGYLLIAKGLSKLSYLEDRIATARRFAFYLVFVELAKLLSSALVFTTNVENTRLTVAFLFFVVELWLSLVFVSNAFKGVQYLAIRKDGNLALKGYEVAKFFLMVFFAIKPICAFLPSSTTIFFPDIDADGEVVENYAQMVNTFAIVRSVFFFIGAALCLALGIYSARILRAYLVRCGRDEGFCQRLRDSYDEKVTKNQSMLTRIAIKRGFLYFFLAFLFLSDLYLDDIGLIPQFLFPLLAFFGMKTLAKQFALPKWYFAVSFAAISVSLASYLYRTVKLVFSQDPVSFGVGFVLDPIALALGILSLILCVAVAVLVGLSVNVCVKEYTQYRYRMHFVFLVIFSAILCGLAFAQYRFPSTFSVLPSVQWLLWAVGLYLHKKSLDEIRAEADYNLM